MKTETEKLKHQIFEPCLFTCLSIQNVKQSTVASLKPCIDTIAYRDKLNASRSKQFEKIKEKILISVFLN